MEWFSSCQSSGQQQRHIGAKATGHWQECGLLAQMVPSQPLHQSCSSCYTHAQPQGNQLSGTKTPTASIQNVDHQQPTQQRSFAQPLRCEMFRSSGFLSEQVCEIALILPKLCHAKNTEPCTPEPPSSPARAATQQHVFIRKYLAFFCKKLLRTQAKHKNQFSNATHSNHLHQECGPPPNQCSNAAWLSPLDVKCSVPQAFSRNRSVKLFSSCQSSATQRTLRPAPLNPLHPLQERQLSSTSSFASIWPCSAPSCYTHTHRPSTRQSIQQRNTLQPPPSRMWTTNNQRSNAALLSPLDVKCSVPQAFSRNRSVKLLSSCQSSATQRTLSPVPLNPLHPLQERQLSSTSSFASIWPSSAPSSYTHRPSTTTNSATQHTPTTSIKNVDHHPTNAATQLCSAP